MTKQLMKVISKTLFITAILLIPGCVTINASLQDAPPNKDAYVQPIHLIYEKEIQIVKPGEQFQAPSDVPGVSNWFLISDFALKKVNQLQIDNARTQ